MGTSSCTYDDQSHLLLCFSPPCSPSPQHMHTNASLPHPATPLCQHGDLQEEVDRLNTQLLSLKVSHEKEMEELRVSHQREVEEVRRVQRRELEQLNEKHGREITELRREDKKVQEDKMEGMNGGEESRGSRICHPYGFTCHTSLP